MIYNKEEKERIRGRELCSCTLNKTRALKITKKNEKKSERKSWWFWGYGKYKEILIGIEVYWQWRRRRGREKEILKTVKFN